MPKGKKPKILNLECLSDWGALHAVGDNRVYASVNLINVASATPFQLLRDPLSKHPDGGSEE